MKPFHLVLYRSAKGPWNVEVCTDEDEAKRYAENTHTQYFEVCVMASTVTARWGPVDTDPRQLSFSDQ